MNMCTFCGDISQIPNEIQAGKVIAQSLVSLPFFGLIFFSVKNFIKDIFGGLPKLVKNNRMDTKKRT